MHDSYNSIDKCVDVIKQAAEQLGISQKLKADDFTLQISANEIGLIDWAKLYLYPLALAVTDNCDKKIRFEINGLNSDKIVSQAISTIQSAGKNVDHFLGYGNRTMISLQSNSGKLICAAPNAGIIWVCDRTTQSLTMVYSSRTRWPSLEFSRTIRDVITDILLANGWLILHAGAVKTETENLMIIGNSGAGKTTLILAFLNQGAGFIANELLFAKVVNKSLNMLPFAIPVAIGMGTALQFRQITELVKHPYNLLYPPRRMNIDRLARLTHQQWLKRKDKLQVLAIELESLFPSSQIFENSSVDRIIVPDVSLNPTKEVSQNLNSKEIADIFKYNLISSRSKKFTAPWFKLNERTDSDKNARQVINCATLIPPIKFKFHINKEKTAISPIN